MSASPQYAIDVLDDEAPVVSFSKPGRDLRATSIDEVFVEAQADDDFGVARLDLVYAVNGGVEKNVRLASGAGPSAKAMAAGHTFFLEELGLQPGDVVSYFARAIDNDTVTGAKTATSDIYFLQIQPFRKDYRAAESQAGGQQQDRGSGGGANDPSALSEQQRRIVSGTFNVVRDRDKIGAEKFRQDVVFLALTQGQLKERATGLAAQIVARVGDADPMMKDIAGHLEAAAESMAAAEQKLQARDAKNALPPEQQALASLQRAEEAYRDVRVRMDRQQGGGGGGGSGRSAAADELADLFQLEADKLRSQYETFRQSQQQSADNKVDEMLERLKELARRQEQEAERQRQLAGNRQQAGGGGGGTSGARQRQLADETEEAARQLERLSREEQRADLANTAQGLRQAAEAMRQAAASGDASAFARAREAADRLSQARDRLDQQRTDRMARDVENALSQVRRLARTQQEVEQDVRDLPPSGAGRQEQVQQLIERKDLQAGEVDSLERQLDRTASDFRRERQQASRKVQEAADAIRDSRLRDKIRYSRGLVQGAPPDQAATFEEQIGADIGAVEAKLREAAGAVAAPERDARAEALARARGIVRGVESMSQRLDQQRQQGQQGGERGQQAGGQQGRGDQAGGQQGGQAGGGGRQGDPAGGGQRAGGQQMSGDAGGGRVDGGGNFDPRQFQRENRERRTEAETLRRELQALGVDAGDLDALINNMRALDSARVYTDFDEAARLQTQLAEGFRRFEFDLRRKLGAAGADQLLLGGADDTPAAYKKLVEDYYRALAKDRKK